MTIIKSVGVLSVGKFMAIFSFLFGLLYGGCMSIMFLMIQGAGRQLQGGRGGPDMLGPAAFFGAAAIIIVPIISGVVGFIVGILYGVVYNVVAGMVGGIAIELGRDIREDYE